MTLYIGLMSGTSLDGVDGVLADFGPPAIASIHVRAHVHHPFDASIRAELLALNEPGPQELQRCEIAANAVARTYASVVTHLLRDAGTDRRKVAAIGAHGQTVRHQPGAIDGTGYTTQLLNGALLAELCGIDVACDFRRRDVAAGGQGAPLAPGFHAALFAVAGKSIAVLNLGGIANLTVLASDGEVTGFDCGPANALLDGWCQRHQGQAFDECGRWAATGTVIDRLLVALLAEPFLALPPPKSTGRDLFNMAWLDRHIARAASDSKPEDIQATLAAFTVGSVVADLRRHAPDASALLVCGGGARNGHLLQMLAASLPGVRVGTTDERGLPVDQVEAAAFAWLAHRFIERLPGNVVAVTGARSGRVLGALHPA